MPLHNPYDLMRVLPHHARILGVDLGSKTIGLALSDVTCLLATPYRTLPRLKLEALTTQLRSLIERENIGGIVAGLPLSMDGSIGPAAQAAQDWTLCLSEKLGLPACCWDERLSTSAIDRFLVFEVDMSRARRKAVVDKMAAAYILQSWLDAVRPKPDPMHADIV